MVHPFDDPYVIAGQGTIGLEMLEQFPTLDTVIVSTSGGGLIGGIAIAIKHPLLLNPASTIVILGGEV